MGLDFSKKVCYNNFRCGGVAQLVRAFGSHPRGRGVEPLRLHHQMDIKKMSAQKTPILSGFFATQTAIFQPSNL